MCAVKSQLRGRETGRPTGVCTGGWVSALPTDLPFAVIVFVKWFTETSLTRAEVEGGDPPSQLRGPRGHARQS